MEPYHYWLIAAILLTILEIFTATFSVFCFAIGCIFAVISALCGLNFNWQVLSLIIGTVLGFVLVRPFALKFLNKKKNIATNADALIGRIAVVSETIEASKGTGRVMVDGDDWKAITSDNEIIEKGDKVKIVGRDSIILTVKK
ncbi:MAG: NfeD family protein [Bacteroidia bacterium]|nr:NfeD family protein [Bacteroidia bacterium]